MTLARVEDALQRRAVLYDKQGDRHYDYISAWIKATRGSDPDASLYYLAVMLEGGEDPRFIVRRMVILASEDIGNADPAALSRGHRRGRGGRARRPARGALRARAGGDLPRAGAEVQRRRARARRAAQRHVREHGAAPVPAWLRSGPRPGTGARRTTTTRTTAPATSRPQELLPEGVAGARFYEPDEAEARARPAPARDSPGARARSSDNRRAMSTTQPAMSAAAARQASTLLRARPGDRASRWAASRRRAPEQIDGGRRRRRQGAAAVGAAARAGPRALHAPHGAGGDRRLRRARSGARARAGPARARRSRRSSCCRRSTR